MSDVGKRIREIREEKGITQDALGGKIGVHPQTIWRYEHDERVPSVYVLEEIACALGVEPGALFKEQTYIICRACGGRGVTHNLT